MKNKSVPGYKRVFAWMIAVFAMVIPWISYLRIWKLTDAQADVFENYNGYVFDFFYFKWIDFPVFNVADIYVTVTMILLLILILFFYKEEDLDFLNRKGKHGRDNRN